MACSLIAYGAAIQSLLVPDLHGRFDDVVLGFDSLAEYENKGNPFMGAAIGRHANRIENSCFEIGGRIFTMTPNNGRNNLHSGPAGFNSVVWTLTALNDGEEPSIRFTYESPDGESGFPGNLTANIVYRLTSSNGLEIKYDAVADQTTVINLTNHAYFNLAGHNTGNILAHELQIEAESFTPITCDCLPDGKIWPVEGSALDFRVPKKIGQDIFKQEQQIHFGHGYDHNYVVRSSNCLSLQKCATLTEAISGRRMIVETTSPGVQLYTGNHLKLKNCKQGADYDRHGGLCLETQYYPNSLRHRHFPSPIFDTGKHFIHQTSYRFEII